MRGKKTEAAVLAYSLPADLPRHQHPMASVPGADWADGIWWQCAWCLSDNRVIPMEPVGPGRPLTASCDWCKGLTEISRRKAVFA